MGTKSRATPSRSVVLDAALAVIDRAGLHGLTIRALGSELGTAPMTLYTHFGSKRALLDLTFERLLHRLFAFSGGFGWEHEFNAGCRHIRRTLLEHPHWIELLTRVQMPHSTLHVYDRMLRLMATDGFRPEGAMFAFSAVLSHALGSVLVERLMAGSPPIPKQRLALVRGMLDERPAGTYPGVASAAPQFDGWSFDEVFEVGLRSLVTGLAESLPRHGHSGASRRRRRGHE
jgi:AcrR family transcriptional regulator